MDERRKHTDQSGSHVVSKILNPGDPFVDLAVGRMTEGFLI
jgi:hypothetical protein